VLWRDSQPGGRTGGRLKLNNSLNTLFAFGLDAVESLYWGVAALQSATYIP